MPKVTQLAKGRAVGASASLRSRPSPWFCGTSAPGGRPEPVFSGPPGLYAPNGSCVVWLIPCPGPQGKRGGAKTQQFPSSRGQPGRS